MINTYEKNQILTNIFRNGEKTIYIGVSKTAPTETGTNCTEPTAPSYKRFSAKCDTSNWGEPNEGTISNSVVFRFDEAGIMDYGCFPCHTLGNFRCRDRWKYDVLWGVNESTGNSGRCSS